MKKMITLLFAALTVTAQEAGRYTGVASCAHSGCHGSTVPLGATRVLQNEYHTWLDGDRHSKAWNVLFSERSANIVRNMRIRSKPWEARLCLDCHTSNVPAAQVAGKIDVEDGVQCETCHGPASGWRDGHSQKGWTRARSIAAGMVDLSDLERRAALCSGCHVGNARHEVDHELIASGHPALVFELDNFQSSMPPHWKRKDNAVAAWAMGQAVAFRQSVRNLARHAAGDRWPEFSDLNCGSCHHSLRGSGWRQERGWAGRAGLPPWGSQRWIVLRHLAGGRELDEVVGQLSLAVSEMDRDRARDAAARAEDLIEPAIERLASRRWTAADVSRLIGQIAGEERVDDWQAAEQIALSLQTLAVELTRRDPRSPLMKAVDALFEELETPAEFDPHRFAAKLAGVRGSLQ
jgi:hypothetical protein